MAAEDFLFLSGKIKEIKNNTVTIDVTSGSCKGIRKFYINPQNLKKIKGRSLIFFSINSSKCEKGKTYTIKEVN